MLLLLEARLHPLGHKNIFQYISLFLSRVSGSRCNLSRWHLLLHIGGNRVLQREPTGETPASMPACGLRIDQRIRQIGINDVALQSLDARARTNRGVGTQKVNCHGSSQRHHFGLARFPRCSAPGHKHTNIQPAQRQRTANKPT